MLDGERRGWVATPAVSVEAFSGAHSLAPASVALEGTTYAVTPAAVAVHAGIIAGEITGMRVVQRVERSSDRLISPHGSACRLPCSWAARAEYDRQTASRAAS